MTRKELIEFIKENDSSYNYEKVDFKYYTDEELNLIFDRLKRQLRDKKDKKNK